MARHREWPSIRGIFVDWPSDFWRRLQRAEAGPRATLIFTLLVLEAVVGGIGALIAISVGKPAGQGLWVGFVVAGVVMIACLAYLVVVGIATGGSLHDEILGGDSLNVEVDRLLRAERREAKRRKRNENESNP